MEARKVKKLEGAWSKPQNVYTCIPKEICWSDDLDPLRDDAGGSVLTYQCPGLGVKYQFQTVVGVQRWLVSKVVGVQTVVGVKRW